MSTGLGVRSRTNLPVDCEERAVKFQFWQLATWGYSLKREGQGIGKIFADEPCEGKILTAPPHKKRYITRSDIIIPSTRAYIENHVVG